jgi:hypothetical protein
MVTRALRAFGFGFSIVLITIHLQERKLSPGEIGFIRAIAIASASLTGLLAAAAAGTLRPAKDGGCNGCADGAVWL